MADDPKTSFFQSPLGVAIVGGMFAVCTALLTVYFSNQVSVASSKKGSPQEISPPEKFENKPERDHLELASPSVKTEDIDEQVQDAIEILLGPPNLERDAVAIEILTRARGLGHPRGTRNLGTAYRIGRGVAYDPAQAFKYFTEASNQGSVMALVDLGEMHFNGVGALQDDGRALSLFRKAASNNEPVGMYWLGIMYEGGYGVHASIQTAVEWYKLAAAQGNLDAHESLARLRDEGYGLR